MLGKGSRVGPYEIIKPLGKGGVGAVYHAKVVESSALSVGREVALKILRQENLSESDLRRFTREAAYLQALSHQGITRIYDVGDYLNRPYLVMELINGQSIDALIGRDHKNPLSCDHAANIVIQALEALHAAHIAGITHRDLKPGNLMITTQGQVKVLDFGMAQRVSGESRLTASGSILGTPAYMSPEQARGHREWIGTHSDVYAMGAVLYELVTGYQPFRAESSVAVLRAIIEEPLTPPSTLIEGLPSGMENIIFRAMAKDPRDRYQNAEAMAEDLRRFKRGDKLAAHGAPLLKPALRTLYYYRKWIVMGSLALFVPIILLVAIAIRALPQKTLTKEIPVVVEEVAIESTWKPAWNHEEFLGNSIAAAASWDQDNFPGYTIYSPVVPEDRDRRIRIESDIQISFTIEAEQTELPAKVFFSHSTLGEGYVLNLGENLTLQRPRMNLQTVQLATVTSVPWVISAEPKKIEITREGNLIQVRDITDLLNPQILLTYNDIIPLEGANYTGVYFLLPSSASEISHISLARRPQNELISRLEIGDTFRQDGDFERAEQFYRDFIFDFPESERLRDAQYRRGLCLMALGRTSEALLLFDDIAKTSRDDALYFVSSSFQAWQCALRLNRFIEADSYFETIRSSYSQSNLLSYASQDLLASLPERYLFAAQEEALIDPWSAVDLYDSAAAIADYLQQPEAYGAAMIAAADVLISLSEWEESENRLKDLINYAPGALRHRQEATILLAHNHRLKGDLIQAETLYKSYLELSGQDSSEALWAQLWVADLYTGMQRHHETFAIWQELSEYDHIVGDIARNLLGEQQVLSIPVDSSPETMNDLAYFNAVAAALAGDRLLFEEWFQTALSISEPFEWPQLLLNDAWDSEVHLMKTWHRYPSQRETFPGVGP